MKFLHSLKFRIATALLLFLLLFSGLFSVGKMAFEEQRSYNTLLNIATRLNHTARSMVSLGMNYAMNAPRDETSYNRDIRLYYQELHGQIELLDKITMGFMSERFSPSLTDTGETFEPRLSPATHIAVKAVEETWGGFRRELVDELGSDQTMPRLRRAADFISHNHAPVSESIDALIAQIQRQMDLRLEQVNLLYRGLLSAAAIATLIIFFWFYLTIFRPLQRTARGFDRVAQGDFGYQLGVRGSNELALMTRSFNHLSSRLHAIFSLIERIQQGSDLDETLGFVAREFTELLPLDWTGALFVSADNSAVVLERSYRDGRPELVPRNRFRLQGTLLLQCIESGAPLHIPDMLHTAKGNPAYQFLNHLADRGLRDAIFLPITESSPIPGVLAFATRTPGIYTGEHLELLANIAGLITHSFGRTVKLAEHARLAAIGEFATGIAHEIRTPLSTINMALDHFRKLELPEGSAKRAALAHRESKRMERLLEEILLYAKPLQLQSQPLELGHLLRTLIETHAAMAGQKNQEFELISESGDSRVLGDKDRLLQLFLNLAGNACDAAPENSRISWRLANDSDSHSAVVSVTNEGKPISEGDMVRLFDPFFTTKPGGTGLGLGIVRHIVDAHGGEIEIRSTAEEGTVVRVRIPLCTNE